MVVTFRCYLLLKLIFAQARFVRIYYVKFHRVHRYRRRARIASGILRFFVAVGAFRPSLATFVIVAGGLVFLVLLVRVKNVVAGLPPRCHLRVFEA